MDVRFTGITLHVKVPELDAELSALEARLAGIDLELTTLNENLERIPHIQFTIGPVTEQKE